LLSQVAHFCPAKIDADFAKVSLVVPRGGRLSLDRRGLLSATGCFLPARPIMLRADYFHDGYTQSAFVAAVPRLHGALRFTYRPALVEERSQLYDAAGQLSAHLFDCHVAQLLASKIVDWDLVDARRQPVAASAAAVLRMQPELYVRLIQIVLGIAASDVDPTWPPETRERVLDEKAEAAAAGRTIGEIREENDEKNCSWG
jgi:hypothetical protein